MAVALNPRFMTDPHEIRVDEESKLTLHGLLQYYVARLIRMGVVLWHAALMSSSFISHVKLR